MVNAFLYCLRARPRSLQLKSPMTKAKHISNEDFLANYIMKKMKVRTIAQEAIRKRIDEKQRPLRFQDFGYGDEYSEAPYNDYND